MLRRLLAQAETKVLRLTGIRRVVRNIVVFSLVVEGAVAVILTVWFAAAYDTSFGKAAYRGVFHAVSAFNNAGFSLNADSLVAYADDPVVSLTAPGAVIIGGLGLPVAFEMARAWRRQRTWSVLTPITVLVTAVLLTAGTLVFTVVERRNPGTFGPLPGPEKLLAGFFHSATAPHGRVQQRGCGCDAAAEPVRHRSADVHRRRVRRHGCGYGAGCVVGAALGMAVGLPAGGLMGVAGRLVRFPAVLGTAVGRPLLLGVVTVSQYASTRSLPPAAVIRLMKAGLSRALPGLSATPAAYARHRPTSDGDGLAFVFAAPAERDGVGAGAPAACVADGDAARNGLGRTPVLAARAAPPAPVAAMMAAALTVSILAIASFSIEFSKLRGQG